MGDKTLDQTAKDTPEVPLHPIEEAESHRNPGALERDHEGNSRNPRPQLREENSRNSIQTRQNSQYGHLSSPGQPLTPAVARAAVSRQPTESDSVYYGSHQEPRLERNGPSQNNATQWPSHSLAGPNMEAPPMQQGNVYVHPEYQRLNPRYGQNNSNPVWGLAKPLPRVVRPGMRRGESQKQQACEVNPAGESEPAPELGATPGLSSTHSAGAASHSTQPIRQDYASTARQGIPRQRAVYAPQPDGLLRPIESEVSSDWSTRKPGADEVEMEAHPQEEFLNTWAKYRHHLKEPLAEWLATSVAIFIGLSGTLAVSTAGTEAGSRLSQNWAWGLGFMIGIYLAGGISGAHLNPGVSIALWVFRGFPGQRCCQYVLAQTLGAITAAGLAYCLYRDAIFSLAPDASAGSTGLGFYTEPLSYISSTTAFFTEFVADAILLCVIFAMGDDGNAPPGAGMHSFVIGLVIYALCICLGYSTGGCLNPVRDFGPRLVALMAGYGKVTFTAWNGWWFWGCWVATISGSLAGACLYDIFIFIGGESPINYPRRRRKRAKLKKESKWRRRLGIGKQKLPSLEEGIKDLEN